MLSVRSRLSSLVVAVLALSTLTLGLVLGACTQEPEGGDEDIVDGELPPLPDNPPSAKVPPASGVLFGAFVGVGENSTADFENQERRIGRRWVIDNRFYSTEDWTERTQWSIANKKIPLITWEPGAWKLDDIIAGTHDELFRAKATSLKDMGAEIFLRWGHEMNGNWYAWSGEKNGGAAGGPAKYIAAWKHMHDLFQEVGATNVVWVWNPLVTDVPSAAWNHWTNYYPGDEYVDWVGLDAYNWGTSSTCCVWQSFPTLVDALYRDYAGKKPLMLPETSSAELGGSKAAWIREMHATLKTQYPEIKALVWFDINKETDWRVHSTPETLEAYKEMAHDPYFNP
jgi:beta-mannanase